VVKMMMGKVLKNAAVGATSASVVMLLFFAIRRVPINVLYVWSWAMFAAICYGRAAIALSIHGKASDTRVKWKNGLLACVILAGIMAASLVTDPIVGASAQTPVSVAVAALISMMVSEARA
jgi:hypothetical protein